RHYERQIKSAGGERRWISRVVHDVQPSKTHPHVAACNVHAVVVVKLRLTSLVVTFLTPIVDIGTRCSRWDEQCIGLTIVIRRRVVAVVMHGQLARRWIPAICK